MEFSGLPIYGSPLSVCSGAGSGLFVSAIFFVLRLQRKLPVLEQVHLAHRRFNCRDIRLQTAALQLIFNVAELRGTLACAVQLLRGIYQHAGGRQQIFLLLTGGLGFQPGDQLQRNPTGKQRNLRLQDGSQINQSVHFSFTALSLM